MFWTAKSTQIYISVLFLNRKKNYTTTDKKSSITFLKCKRGSVAEWSKVLVLGTSHFDGVGSNPTAAINFSSNHIFFLVYMKSIRFPVHVI